MQHLFGLGFLKEKANITFIGGVGFGKTHLSIALGHAACLQGHSVLFTTAMEAINTLAAAQAQSRLKTELKKFLAPTVLVCDRTRVSAHRQNRRRPALPNDQRPLRERIHHPYDQPDLQALVTHFQ